MPESQQKTDKPTLEEKLSERTAQLEAVSREFEQFSHSVSHDLRAPLRAMEGFAQILVEDHGEQLGEEGKRCVDILASSARKATLLLDDLLTVSRLFRKPYAPGKLAMNALVARKVEEFRVEAGAAAIVVEKLPDAFGDGPLMELVWSHLLENAIKFSRGQAKPTITVSGQEEPGRVVYSIRDNGAGFDPKYAGRLFGVFQRLHAESEFPGRGVGLAIVKRILTRHGGEIWAESKPNAGATFSFSLPRAD